MALLKSIHDKLPEPEKPDPFNLEWQFAQYLKRMSMDPDKMHRVQYIETKKAFFGSWGQLLMLIKHDLGPYNAVQTVQIFQDMTAQVLDFFQEQTNRKN